MLKNYFLIAYRNLRKQKTFTIINITGLGIGMAIAMMTLLYVTNHLSFDRFHKKSPNIYRLILKTEVPEEGTVTSAQMTAGIGPYLQEHIPQIRSMVRFSANSGGYFTYEGKNINTTNLMYADSSVFNVFTFPLLLGNPEKALKEPYAVVLSEELAGKIFESPEEAMGKVIGLNNRDNLVVTGIMKNIPLNSHLQFDALVSFATLYQDPELYLGWNGGMAYYTYLLLNDHDDINAVESQINEISKPKNEETGANWAFFLQPLSKVHLNTSVSYEIGTHTSPVSLWLLSAITLVILLVACVNFINLSTAASLGRMKEVGIRRVAGALKRQVVIQFLIESVIISMLALLFAFVFLELFDRFLSSGSMQYEIYKYMQFENSSFFKLAGISLFLILATGLIAGTYPAYYISKMKPVLSVRGRVADKKGNPVLRNLLVVFQFTISIVLIICTVVIALQLNLLLTKDKGFKAANKIVIPMGSEKTKKSYEALKTSFLSVAGVESVGASSDIPGQSFTQNGYRPEGISDWMMIHVLDVDYDYLETMHLKIIKGRNFSRSFGQDQQAYIINQTLAKKLGWQDPIGKTISRGGDHKVIGVVKDFNYSPLQSNIEPLIITPQPWRGYDYLTLRLSGELTGLMKSELESQWKSVVPFEDFSFFRLDNYVKGAYKSERLTLHILIFCAVIALLLASIGLLALAAFITRQRYREIAVRKVFGAATGNIIYSVSTGFIRWVLIANLVAWPFTYLILEKYLSHFAYSAGIQWWVFLLALVFSLLLSLLVIVFQVLRLGRLNPVEYIRFE